MEKIDLHIHSTLSDGVLTPKEIIDEAVKNGVSVIAIADHDNIDAYTDEFYNYAKENGIQIINAVEISTKTEKAGIHVLGYNFNIENAFLKEKLNVLKNVRHEYLNNVAKKLKELNYFLEIKELEKIEAVTKAHIALNVINHPKNTDLLLQQFGHIPNKGKFIETIMNEGCPAYVKKNTITPQEASKIIKEAGGKVVLAHPVAYEYEDNLNEEAIANLVTEMKADGIEAYYIYVDRNNNKIDEIKKWKNFADQNNLLVTIGSDFHNEDGIRPQIGLINERLNLNDEDVNNIIEDILKE